MVSVKTTKQYLRFLERFEQGTWKPRKKKMSRRTKYYGLQEFLDRFPELELKSYEYLDGMALHTTGDDKPISITINTAWDHPDGPYKQALKNSLPLPM